jgi:hypothetical protein
MRDNEADLRKIIGRLKIDSEPNPAHRARLRREMLDVFKEAGGEHVAGAKGLWAVMIGNPFVKLAAAAAIVAGVVMGAYRLAAPEKPREPVVRTEDTEVTGPVYTGTPEFEPLYIELPKPMFVGTPQDARVKNLEKPLGRPRDEFLAPVGTRNIALGKRVFSSDREPAIGDIGLITDGDKEATEGSYVELKASLQHVTIDLGGAHEIWAIVVWHYHKQPRVYFDVIVQTADDADFSSGVRTLFNNDMENSAGLGAGKDMHYTETYEGKLVDGKGVRARYVRLLSRGNNSDDLNHYIEVEVYGRPTP